MSSRYSARPPRGRAGSVLIFEGGGAPVWSSSGGGTPWWWQTWPRGWDPLGWWRTRARGWSPGWWRTWSRGWPPSPRWWQQWRAWARSVAGHPTLGAPLYYMMCGGGIQKDGRSAWIARPGRLKRAPLGAASFPPTVSGIDARQHRADCPGVLRSPLD